MKKRLFTLITLMVLMLSLPLSASADLIYEPRDDFYEQHSGECNYVNRGYIANSPNGELTIYKSPENSQIQGTISNGEKVYISFVYTDADGIRWGCAEPWEEDIIGWVPMPYVVAIYNGTSFLEEFEDRLEEESGIVPSFGDQEVRFWSYPGSESCSTRAVGDDPRFAPDYYYIFVDDAGQKWAKIGYYHGIHSSWVCLDNPTADYDTLYANHAPQKVSKPEIQLETQEGTQPVTSGEMITPSGISAATILITVAAVAAISTGLLVVLKKKKS